CDVTIAIDLPDLAIGDGVRLRAALENLADNAVKFTEQGRVAMTARVAEAPRKSHRVVFAFADSGIGMHRAAVARLFRPLAQANASVARRFGGAGLGLLFVRRLARAMGGRVMVDSALGRGSTFTLTVALKPAAQESRMRSAGKPASASRGLRVLCAE